MLSVGTESKMASKKTNAAATSAAEHANAVREYTFVSVCKFVNVFNEISEQYRILHCVTKLYNH